MEQKTFEIPFYYQEEEVICINQMSEYSYFLTEGCEYEVLAFNVDTHQILILDDSEEPVWVEAELFVPVDL